MKFTNNKEKFSTYFALFALAISIVSTIYIAKNTRKQEAIFAEITKLNETANNMNAITKQLQEEAKSIASE